MGNAYKARGVLGAARSWRANVEKTNLEAFAKQVTLRFSEKGGANRLAAELLRTSMAPRLNAMPDTDRGYLERAVHAYLAPALLGFAKAWDANQGMPFPETTQATSVTTQDEFVPWGEAERTTRRVAESLGIKAIEEERALPAAEYARLALGDPRIGAARAKYEDAVRRTAPQHDEISDQARKVGYGEQHQRSFPSNAGERAQPIKVRTGDTQTVVRPDPYKVAVNALIDLQRDNPTAFGQTLSQLTNDPAPFVAVLLRNHVSQEGAYGEVVRAAHEKLVNRDQEPVLRGFAALYRAMRDAPESRHLLSTDQGEYDLPRDLGFFLASQVPDDEDRLNRLAYAGTALIK